MYREYRTFPVVRTFAFVSPVVLALFAIVEVAFWGEDIACGTAASFLARATRQLVPSFRR